MERSDKYKSEGCSDAQRTLPHLRKASSPTTFSLRAPSSIYLRTAAMPDLADVKGERVVKRRKRQGKGPGSNASRGVLSPYVFMKLKATSASCRFLPLQLQRPFCDSRLLCRVWRTPAAAPTFAPTQQNASLLECDSADPTVRSSAVPYTPHYSFFFVSPCSIP